MLVRAIQFELVVKACVSAAVLAIAGKWTVDYVYGLPLAGPPFKGVLALQRDVHETGLD